MSMASVPAPAAALALLNNSALTRLLTLLNGDGEEARVVGGAIRNALIGRDVHEIDIATTALPDIVVTRAEAAGLRSVPTGLAHGTITLLVAGQSFEVTSLREDVETDGRHARVRFGRDFEIDALRRDFTINAFSMTPDGRMFDYVGGFADLAARRVRFIGDPMLRIREDYLRILRFFRFSADYADGPLDALGFAAALDAREGLLRLSRERVHAELFKLLVARRAGDVVGQICEAGLLLPLLACAPDPGRFARLAAILDNDVDRADPLLRLAGLCLRVAEDAKRLRDKLRLSNEEDLRLIRAADALVALHGTESLPDSALLKRLLFRFGRRAALDGLALAQAERGGQANWSDARAYLRREPEPRLPFSGNDVISRGVTDGRAIGEALKTLQANWIRSGFPDDPHTLARLLDEATRST
jgi:poly(A) polymerase